MKRLVDVLGALFALALLWPIVVVVGAIVWWKMGLPLFFVQTRPGLNCKSFKMVKFRTMLNAVDKNGESLPDGERLTTVGRFLRASSLDELPELWNVLRGEMSLVGPRPLLMEYLPRYSPEQARRHEVKPGITGWAQVNGRNALSWEEKFTLDIWYVDHHSFWLDMKILLKTMAKVFAREGINNAGHATMPVFTNSKSKTDEISK
jgi:lipopolysaccharide/colanic/teichoic acid biosynthesis glycosyltransferase